tara:strand:- start:1974 stop:3581 length:1608 start_codon:yes stop_codon:yes gene_type:complete
MEDSSKNEKVNKIATEIKIFPIPVKYLITKNNENIVIITNNFSEFSEEQIINKAFKLHSKGNILEASKYYQYFINQGFKDPRLFCNYGTILKDLGKFKEAEKLQRKAIELKPDFAEAHCNLGLIFKNLDKIKEAKASIRKAIQLKPDFAQAHSNLGIILGDIGRLKEAELSQRKALELNPYFAEAHCNLGLIMSDLGKVKEAELAYRQAIKIKPDFAAAHENLSHVLLKQMKFKEGWEHYEWRWKVKNRKLHIGEKLETSKPDWSHNNRGRVLLWSEQGIGDQILFLSILPDFIDKVSKLIIRVDKRLFPLLKRSLDNKNIEYFSKEDYINENEYDFQIPFGSLPRYLRPTLKSFVISKNLKLLVNKEKSNYFKKILLSKKYKKIVGISWKSISILNRNKSLSLEEFILGIYSPEICFVSLQYGDVKEEIININKKYGINIYEIEEVDKFNNIDDLAALISSCDEVVSIDNLTQNLAGAIGIKSYILLSKNCAWMNGNKELKSNWYPSLNLIRRNQDETWYKALKQIKKSLIRKN